MIPYEEVQDPSQEGEAQALVIGKTVTHQTEEPGTSRLFWVLSFYMVVSLLLFLLVAFLKIQVGYGANSAISALVYSGWFGELGFQSCLAFNILLAMLTGVACAERLSRWLDKRIKRDSAEPSS